jgi:hypothetical protein
VTNPTTSNVPAARTPRKDLRLPDLPSTARKSAVGVKRNGFAYSPKRGQEFAFQVEMSTREAGLQKQWIGTPYFAGVYSDVRSSFAEMFCIGTLACRVRSSADRPWSPDSIEDIEFPQQFLFGSHGVLNAETASLFQQHTLPLQLSAILPLEEIVFPALPFFSDSTRNESRKPATFFLRGGQKNLFRDSMFTTLDGELTSINRLENEKSTVPRIVNERTFHCPSQEINLSYRQSGNFDGQEGMIQDSDLDYLLELGEKVRLTVKVRRLYGNDLATARAAALKSLPPDEWPAYYRRMPADDDKFVLHIPRTPEEIPRGQRVSVSLEIKTRNAHGFRSYLARTIGATQEGKVRVRLDGSNEEMDVSHISLRLPKSG